MSFFKNYLGARFEEGKPLGVYDLSNAPAIEVVSAKLDGSILEIAPFLFPTSSDFPEGLPKTAILASAESLGSDILWAKKDEANHRCLRLSRIIQASWRCFNLADIPDLSLELTPEAVLLSQSINGLVIAE